ncbi:MAG: lysophospholipid acyltransferase family protein [Planctomycetaceae bacterium]|jgi:lysophospholipid acyltransferase (LPLAT)-like uncharacterized protein|nr:lysophospholipid acyltransferase family protein [Planctomycetaceae bacterium]
MGLLQDWLLKGTSLTISALIRRWMGSLDYKVVYHDPNVDPAFPVSRSQKRIYVFWHEYILFLLYLRKRCGLSMLLSRHRDADYLEQVARIFGFGTVRGSTKRGGAAAILEMMSQAESNHLAITPDGPRGPRRKLAPGCVFLASKLQLPLVIIGLGYQNPWRVPTWDRFAIPRPCSRARAVVSPEINIPPNLDSKELAVHCHAVEAMINRLTDLAEDWANSGETYLNQIDMVSGPLNEFCYYPRLKSARTL